MRGKASPTLNKQEYDGVGRGATRPRKVQSPPIITQPAGTDVLPPGSPPIAAARSPLCPVSTTDTLVFRGRAGHHWAKEASGFEVNSARPTHSFYR